MKKTPQNNTANRTTKQPAPVGRSGKDAHTSGGETGARGATWPNAAQCSRPPFVHDTDVADFDELGFVKYEPSPLLYTCACSHVWDETRKALESGDNDLLIRPGVAEALGVISSPYVGTGAAVFDLIFEEWRADVERGNIEAEKARKITDEQKVLRRVDFWRTFDDTRTPDADIKRERVFYLRNNTALAEMLRTAKKLLDDEFRNKLADAVFEHVTDVEKIRRERPGQIWADWLNERFYMAGELLAKWLDFSSLPGYERTVEELRKRQADNFGVFPAPFFVNSLGQVELKFDTLERLRYIAHDMRRRKEGHDAAHPSGVENEIDTASGQAGEWAKRQGVKGYNGRRFEFNGEVITRDGKAPERWRIFAAVIESTETDGAARLGTWRGKFSSAKNGALMFSRHIHPVESRGAGWYHILPKEIKPRTTFGY